MNNKISRLICILLIIFLMPVVSFGADNVVYVANSSFNMYSTYSEPDDLDINSRLYWVHEYRENDKGLMLSGQRSNSTLSYKVSAANEVCISFDIKTFKDCPQGNLYIAGSDGKKQPLLIFDGKNHIKSVDKRYITGYNAGALQNVAVVYTADKSVCDIYVNGKEKYIDYKISKYSIDAVSQVTFEFNHNDASAVLLDNINITCTDKPLKSYPVDDYSDVSENEITLDALNFEAVVGNAVLHNSDFEIMHTLTIHQNGNKLDIIEDVDGNKVFAVNKIATQNDCHMNAHNLVGESDYVVFEVDVKLLDEYGFFNTTYRDENDKDAGYIALRTGRELHMGKTTKILDKNRWYRLSLMIDYYDRQVSYYLDKEFLATEPMGENEFVGSKARMWRIHGTPYSKYGPKSDNSNDYMIYFDNMRVYEGKELLDDLGSVEKEIVISNKTVFDRNTGLKKQLENHVALHTRSGVVFKDGKKDILLDTPHVENGVVMVNAAELSEKLGVENPYTEKYVPADQFFTEGLKMMIYTDNTCLNGGLIIAGNTRYNAPTDPNELQKLNDFLWLLQPEKEVILDIYDKSKNKGIHPRLHATKEDFERVKQEIEIDPIKKVWAESLIKNADRVIDQAVVFYELRDGTRLLGVAREVRVKLYTLGMAYQLTGDTKYSDRAWKELEAVCAFPDWHPSHTLDTAEMAAGVAIGYDWMYHAFTDEQRKIIEKAMYNHVFYDANILYATAKGQMSTNSLNSGNWNNVVSGGVTMACLSMLDVYPEIAAHVMCGAIKSISTIMWRFAPEGAWYEGPSYWELVARFTIKLIECANTTLGTSLGLDTATGLSGSSEYMLYSQSPLGIYPYGDALIGTKCYSPEMIWYAEYYGKKDVEALVVDKCIFKNGEDFALGLLWKDPHLNAENVTLPLDKFYEIDDSLIFLRDSWTNEEQTFVGIHAGKTNTAHYHLDGGSFIFDSMGVRWAHDIGQQNYNIPGYWDEVRKWTIYGLRAEAHNTLVINPGANEDHKIASTAPVTKYESKPRGVIATVDMTDLFETGVISAKRGFAFADDRTSLVIRDEVNVQPDSDVYWFMTTKSAVAIEGNTAILSENGRKLKLEFVASDDADFSVGHAEPLPTSPKHQDDDPQPESTQRIMIHMKTGGQQTITVKLTPYDNEISTLESWNVPIDSWHIPDGEIPEKPSLSVINVGDRQIVPQKNIIDYYYLEGTLSSVPKITATDERYNIEVQKGGTLDDAAVITVTDKSNAYNRTVYNIIFTKVPKPIQFEGMTSIPIVSVVASDEPQEANKARNVIDNDLSTRWSASGAGCTLTVDLETVQRVDNIGIAYSVGDQRSTRISVAVSKDGAIFEDVFTGLSSGKTLEHEFVPLGGRDARYVRITCNGNTSSASSEWNSITEVVVTRNN